MRGIVLGPCTLLPEEHVRAKLLVVAGEDPGHVAAALPDGEVVHEHRGYRFWHVGDDVLVVSAGMGSAALEPLLWEVLGTGRVERALLAGTAGSLGAMAADGEPRWVDRAHVGWMLLDGARDPVLPRWSPMPDLPFAATVSTERFYGFSPTVGAGDGHLVRAFEAWRDRNVLVDMETAAFFHFASRFDVTRRLRFGAVRVPANGVDDLESLAKTAPEATRVAVQTALDLFP